MTPLFFVAFKMYFAIVELLVKFYAKEKTIDFIENTVIENITSVDNSSTDAANISSSTDAANTLSISLVDNSSDGIMEINIDGDITAASSTTSGTEGTICFGVNKTDSTFDSRTSLSERNRLFENRSWFDLGFVSTWWSLLRSSFLERVHRSLLLAQSRMQPYPAKPLQLLYPADLPEEQNGLQRYCGTKHFEKCPSSSNRQQEIFAN